MGDGPCRLVSCSRRAHKNNFATLAGVERTSVDTGQMSRTLHR